MIRQALIPFLSIAAIAGCSFQTEQSDLTTATFRVESVDGTVVDETVIPRWNIPTERRFNLKVCVRNLAGRDDIHNHPFEIVTEAKAYRTVTDGQGCAHWTEIVPFDYLAQPTFVRAKRVIRSLGKQRGEVEFLVAINPWSGLLGSEPGVVDINYGRNTVPRIADMDVNASALRTASARRTELEIETIKYELQMNSPSAQQDASLHIEFNPSLVLKKMSGENDRRRLERGLLEVTPYVLRLNLDGTSTLIHQELRPVPVEIKNGVVVYHQGIKFAGARLDPQATYKVALVVTATTGPNYIADFRRFYDIPNFQALQGGTLSLSTNQAERGFDASAQGLSQILGVRPPSDEGVGFFTVTKIGGGNNGLIDESMMQRRVRLSMNADVRWAANLTALQGRRFIVYSMQKDANGNRRVIEPKGATDPSGMLYWEDEVIHHMYQAAHRHKYEVIIEDTITRQRVQRCIYTNPWDFWATFFRDCNEVNETFENAPDQLVAPVPRMPLLKVDGVGLSRTDSAISDGDILSMISSDLSLITKHRYNLQIAASVLRYDDLRTGMQTPAESLRGGWWLLSVAVFRNSPSQGTVGDRSQSGLLPVYTFEKAICNPGTVPAAEIEIALKDISIIDRNNYVAFQLLPLKQESLRFVESADSPPTGAYCAGKQVTPDSPLEIYSASDVDERGVPVVQLVSPAYIAAMNLRNGSSPVVISHNNFEDPRLIALDNQLKTKSVHQFHLEYTMRQAAEKAAEAVRLSEERESGWNQYGQHLGLQPFVLAQESDFVRAFPNVNPPGLPKLFETLKCLDEDFWADAVHQATCTLDPQILHTAKLLCYTATVAAADGLPCDQPLVDLRVEQKVHVYGISEANYSSGFSTSLTISSSFNLGSFNGSDFGHAYTDSASVGANGGVGISKGPFSLGAEVGLSKSSSAFNVNFTREWSDNQVGVGASTTLNVENADINLRLKEYRYCYRVTTRLTQNKGYYLCTGILSEPVWRTERYFTIFNAGFNGSILNTNDERNRWLLQFRGERTYYHLLASLNANFAPFNLDGNAILLTDMLKRTYPKFAERAGWGDPYVMSTLAPGQDRFSRIEGSIRDMPLIGFDPFNQFGNTTLRDQNDPTLRVHDHDSNFTGR